ncbi:hypothetical protein [Stenotrophomonas maltophilia group sp. CASM26]|jgi:hypothetical protein|uniref:hypothetical protein n=1 Tax=Stenotrophomonas maltophilia group sp. CASM26 TaxID=3111514 RepID=UPI003BF8A9FD
MVDQPLHERLEHLIGWDGMIPEARFDAARKADLLDLLDRGIGRYTYDELVHEAERNREELDDCLGYYITDEDDDSCGYYNISELDQFNGSEAIEYLGQLFPELEIDPDEDMDDWLRAFVRRTRLEQITGRSNTPPKPGKL